MENPARKRTTNVIWLTTVSMRVEHVGEVDDGDGGVLLEQRALHGGNLLRIDADSAIPGGRGSLSMPEERTKETREATCWPSAR